MNAMTEATNGQPQFDYDAFELPENVALEFRLAPHMNGQDLPSRDELSDLFERYDAIIPELVSSTPGKAGGDFARIAMGDIKTYQKARSVAANNESTRYWHEAFCAALYNTKVRVLNVDITTSHPAHPKMMRSLASMSKYMAIGIPDRMVEDSIPYLQQFFEALKMRDQTILGNIKPTIEGAVRNDHRLATRAQAGPLAIGLFYGTTHYSLVQALSAKNVSKPTEGFSVKISPDTVLDDEVDFYGAYLRGEEWSMPTVRRHLAAKAVWQSLIASGIVTYRDMSFNLMSWVFAQASEGLEFDEYPETSRFLLEKITRLVELAKEYRDEEDRLRLETGIQPDAELLG